MGEAFTAVADDLNALYWNPAGMAGLERATVGATHQEAYEGINHEFAGSSSRAGRPGLGPEPHHPQRSGGPGAPVGRLRGRPGPGSDHQPRRDFRRHRLGRGGLLRHADLRRRRRGDRPLDPADHRQRLRQHRRPRPGLAARRGHPQPFARSRASQPGPRHHPAPKLLPPAADRPGRGGLSGQAPAGDAGHGRVRGPRRLPHIRLGRRGRDHREHLLARGLSLSLVRQSPGRVVGLSHRPGICLQGLFHRLRGGPVRGARQLTSDFVGLETWASFCRGGPGQPFSLHPAGPRFRSR